MPGMDKPTGRVVALIVLLLVVAAALRGYLPAQHDATRSEAGGRSALGLVVAILAVTLALIAVAIVARLKDPRAPAPPAGALSETLGWLAATETTIRWSESTRADWDRHLRPMLARRYAIATGQRHAKDPASFQATGQMLFGAELWEWVNPNNVTRTGGRQPGPGRAALEEILRKLEQV